MVSKPKTEILKIKQFGYVISAVLLVLSNIALINESPSTPFIFIVTMYFLTASLWAPRLIKVFYTSFGKYLFKNNNNQNKQTDTDHFSRN